MKLFAAFSLFVVAVSAYPGAGTNSKNIAESNATPHQAPYIVSVQVDREGNGNYRHTCGGSILSATWVLTSAQCTTNKAEMCIVAGEHNLAVPSGTEQTRLITNVIIHENYIESSSAFDIALMSFDTPLQLIPGVVESIRIPSPNKRAFGNVQVFGWGSISSPDLSIVSDTLETSVRDLSSMYICNDIMTRFYGRIVSQNNVCTFPARTEDTFCSG